MEAHDSTTQTRCTCFMDRPSVPGPFSPGVTGTGLSAPRHGAGASACPPLLPHSHSYSSGIKMRSYLQYLKRKVVPPPSPPYGHVCQVGDPVLRLHAAAVDPEAIAGPEVQRVIAAVVKAMRRFECVGLSAPQIGVPLRILALEYPEKMLQETAPASRALLGLSAQPLRVFVNPRLRVLDQRTALFQEACESIAGFSAAVPRYLSVEVSGTSRWAVWGSGPSRNTTCVFVIHPVPIVS
ncbi:Peptide deformylase, mitochondrial [Liparis tanakae]|uniref:Peptide deformylase n=1 Tax=Liparis tanakae TaxID=230148 RepID=A0A4Z2E5D0_9TELE|nr:Peptide deformylase, mitochondrial [Liparis tanakae]